MCIFDIRLIQNRSIQHRLPLMVCCTHTQGTEVGMGARPPRGRIPEDSAAGRPVDVEAQPEKNVEAGKPVTY